MTPRTDTEVIRSNLFVALAAIRAKRRAGQLRTAIDLVGLEELAESLGR